MGGLLSLILDKYLNKIKLISLIFPRELFCSIQLLVMKVLPFCLCMVLVHSWSTTGTTYMTLLMVETVFGQLHF